MFTNPFPNAFGLDLSDLSLKLVQLQSVTRFKQEPRFDLVSYRSVDIPHGLIMNGEIQEPEKVRKYLLHLLGMDKEARKETGWKPIRGRWVVATLPEPQSVLKLIELDKPQIEVIENDILEAAQKHVPFDPGSYYIDWQILPEEKTAEGTKKTRVCIGAVPKHIANSYTYLLESLGLGVIALELEALAVARAMITATKTYEGEARAILDLGATRSSLIIYDEECVQFSTSLPFSGEMLTNLLSKELNISYEEAEKRKKENGVEVGKSGGAAVAAISGCVDQLAKEIQKNISFYQTHFHGTNRITHITMCGGSASLKNLDMVLTEKLGIETLRGNAWKNLMQKKEVGIAEDISLRFAPAIGLALRAADNPFSSRDII